MYGQGQELANINYKQEKRYQWWYLKEGEKR
jgi:hypothetical protein